MSDDRIEKALEDQFDETDCKLGNAIWFIGGVLVGLLIAACILSS